MIPSLEAVARTRPELAQQLDAGWSTPISEWSAGLWADPPEDAGFEPPFRRALVTELADRLGAEGADQLVTRIEASGAVLTPHHVCPTNGPTFGGIDRVACLGQPGPVLVLAWAGVPMSNSAWSGALCFQAADYGDLLRQGPELSRQRAAARDRERDGVTEKRIALLPPEMRDVLVHGCPMAPRVGEVIAAATPRLRPLLPDLRPGEDYPGWAIRVGEGVARNVAAREDLWYVDLNRVACRYLVQVLADPDHPVSRLMAVGQLDLPNQSWFYARRPGKRESVETLYGRPDDLRERLAAGQLCPGLVPVFGALRLLSRIRLLGGFRQVGYLEEIASAWLRAGIVEADRGVPGRPITARLRMHPLDVATGAVDRAELPSPDAPMSVVWEPMLARLGG